MLVIRRNPGDAIIIDGDIKITVLGIDRGRVSIGITAPSDVDITREELLSRNDESCVITQEITKGQMS